jgi:hypothetical protein
MHVTIMTTGVITEKLGGVPVRLSLIPWPERGGEKGLVPIACACTYYPRKTGGNASCMALLRLVYSGSTGFSWGSWRMRMQ